jgi:acyl-CoA thioester hydrolase
MTILKLHSEPLRDEWLDAYGHLNEAYYLVPFSTTTWILQEHFDIGVPYFEETGCAIYTVETHMRYLNDVRKPAVMDMESMILDSDPKKIWLAHQMVVDNVICATAEFMLLHYNTRENSTTPMPDAVQRKLQEAEMDDVPGWVGGQIRMTKK